MSSHSHTYQRRGEILAPCYREQLSARIVEYGPVVVAEEAGLSRMSILSGAAGAPIWPVTREALVAYLGA